MQKLHLVGFTTDHEGLILSARRGSRSGGYLLPVDEAVEEAVEALRAHRAEEPEVAGDTADAPRAPRVESTLPVREIQARLRQGRSIADVAKAAGVDVAWVERFAPPILAERAQVISRVQSAPLRRARLGPSALPIGDAVRHHLADRAVALSPEEFASAWTARQLANGRWAVRFTFHHRGRNNVLRFDFDEGSSEVTAADRQSGQLGYVTPTGPATKTRRPSGGGAPARRAVSRPVVSTGFRADPTSTKAVSRSAKERERAAAAMRKAAAQRAAEVERAAARRARERAAEIARKAREDRAAAAQAARDERSKAAADRAKAAATKKLATERAKAKETAAKERRLAAEKRAADKKQAQKQAAVKKAASKKAAATKNEAVANKPAATKKAAAKTAAAPTKVTKNAVTKTAVTKTAAAKAQVARPPATTTARRSVSTASAAPRVPASVPAPRPAAATPVEASAARVAPTVAAPAPRPRVIPPVGSPIRRVAPGAPAHAAPRASDSGRAAAPTEAPPVDRTQPVFNIVPRPATSDQASFRQGAAESVGEGADPRGPRSPAVTRDRTSNGDDPSAPQRFRLGRPRRTRPLRAT